MNNLRKKIFFWKNVSYCPLIHRSTNFDHNFEAPAAVNPPGPFQLPTNPA